MKYAFRFSQLVGSMYKCGNVAFTPAGSGSDGGLLLSPVGNRITCFDLVNHVSYTLDAETRSDISRIAVSPDGRLVVAVDIDGYAVFINLLRRVIIHRMRFGEKRDTSSVVALPTRAHVVSDLRFSPDGAFLCVCTHKRAHVWRVAGLGAARTPSPIPLALHRSYGGHTAPITCVTWSPTGRYLATGSEDMCVRVHSLHPTPGFVPVTLSGHRDAVLTVAWAEPDLMYTVARDGAVFTWAWMERPDLSAPVDEDEEEEGGPAAAGRKRRRSNGWERVDGSTRALVARRGGVGASVQDITDVLATRRPHAVPAPYIASDESEAAALSILRGEWTLRKKAVCKQDGHTRVASAVYHAASAMLVIGFTNGTFGLYTMPDATPIHTLSISSHAIHSVDVNVGGDWVAFASRDLGQLLVWEWKSETYVLKQQGHFYDMNAVAYSPNGQLMATGGDDGKVKVWNVSTGFCFVTFSEHTAPVTAVAFIGGKKGHGLAIVSASLDGTVRAFDLVRYRMFRTLTPPEPAQLTCLATDDAGEVIAAGSMDPYTIYTWSLQTGRLLDAFTGHEAPVCSLQFSTIGGMLVSGSWDKTARVWDVFRSGTSTETFRHSTDVLAVTVRPDGAQACVSTLDGQLHFWDVKRGIEVGFIDCRRDASGGRLHDEARTAKTSSSGKSFTTIAYTADGECVLAGGKSKYVCLYAVAPRLLVRKWQMSHNRSMDGMLDKLHSKGVAEGGLLATLDLEPTETDRMGRVAARIRDAAALPGVSRGNLSAKRALHPEIRSKCIQFSPTNRSFAVACTEGLLVYTVDETLFFDPLDLGEGIDESTVLKALRKRHFGAALLAALHLNESSLLLRAISSVPSDAIELVARAVPPMFLQRLMEVVAEQLGAGTAPVSPYLDFFLQWCMVLLIVFGELIRDRIGVFAGTLRSLQRALIANRESFGKLIDTNRFTLRFLADMAAEPPAA